MKNNFPVPLVVMLLIALFSCHSDEIDTKGTDYAPLAYFDKCETFNYDIPSLAFGDLPNIGYSMEAIHDTAEIRDDDGVLLFEWENRFYYHPVAICHRTFALLGAYHYRKDTIYLNMAKKHVDRLVKEAVDINGALFYPYHFDYRVHKRQDALLPAPWFSGMAQGEALSVLVRLYKVTSDSTCLDAARRTFLSLQRMKEADSPWVSFIDDRGCFWIEEYPLDPPSMTLNSFIAAIFGVYDYYQLTQDEKSRIMLVNCFNTVRNYIPLFRRPGRVSYYKLRFQHYDAGYHLFHIKQLRQLAKIAGDAFFNQWADSLQKDYDPENVER
ncbi:MAG: D-glucuronyl C5-epimerase family protein [candidate division Zixibacteria bacterium]|nr:D-glucuronyl C5-epimerase family protein [candidate division Zixibacteria bacterium]